MFVAALHLPPLLLLPLLLLLLLQVRTICSLLC
jgi:hypothetical protein